jgi:hypothetical protein
MKGHKQTEEDNLYMKDNKHIGKNHSLMKGNKQIEEDRSFQK